MSSRSLKLEFLELKSGSLDFSKHQNNEGWFVVMIEGNTSPVSSCLFNMSGIDLPVSVTIPIPNQDITNSNIIINLCEYGPGEQIISFARYRGRLLSLQFDGMTKTFLSFLNSQPPQKQIATFQVIGDYRESATHGRQSVSLESNTYLL